MRLRTRRLVMAMAIALLSAWLLTQPAAAVESPPEGIPPDEFATEYSGCLGQLRSMIARGEFDGQGPFGEHFTGDVNPGAHQGTVGEEEFLSAFFGLEGEALREFCAQFEP